MTRNGGTASRKGKEQATGRKGTERHRSEREKAPPATNGVLTEKNMIWC